MATNFDVTRKKTLLMGDVVHKGYLQISTKESIQEDFVLSGCSTTNALYERLSSRKTVSCNTSTITTNTAAIVMVVGRVVKTERATAPPWRKTELCVERRRRR